LISSGLLITTIILISFYVATPKILSSFEIMFSWMLAVFIDDAFFTVVSLNLEWIETSDQLNDLWLRVLSLYLLTPVITLWTIKGLRSARRWQWKSILFIMGMGFILGVDIALAQIGVWSIPAWFYGLAWVIKSIVLISLVSLSTWGFRKLLRRDGLVQ
jgi:hypothetical protein